MTKFNPYLNFAGNTEDAFNFYKSVFGGEFVSLVRFKDMPIEGVNLPREAEDKIMHIALPIGNGHMLMGTDTLESMGHRLVSGNNLHISIHPDTKEEADRLFNSLSKGGKVHMPIADQPWGDYYGDFQDKFGMHWMINYHKEQ
jgi:PhnB protein